MNKLWSALLAILIVGGILGLGVWAIAASDRADRRHHKARCTVILSLAKNATDTLTVVLNDSRCLAAVKDTSTGAR